MPVPTSALTRPPPGARPVEAVASVVVLEVAPNAPWHFVFYGDHPSHWLAAAIEPGEGVPEEDVGTWWLPVLDRRQVKPGLKGVRTLAKGQDPKLAYSRTHQRVTDEGGIVLDLGLGYRVPWDCKHPVSGREGTYYAEAFEAPRRKVRGRRLEWAYDRQRYYRWLLSLMRAGVFPEPDEGMLAEHAATAEVKIARRAAIVGMDDDAKAAHVDEARVEASRVEAARVPAPEGTQALTKGKAPPTRRKSAPSEA